MSNKQDTVAVRYPPSPTGELHIGNIRTILFNYLFAKHHEFKQGGISEIYMRFEDTDTERSKLEYEQVALETLDALGLEFDHGPYRQSERGDLYTKAIKQLINQGHAYEAEESQDGSGDKVIRFKNPNTKISFNDIVRGEVTIDTTDFGDFVIARSMSNPLYHLTVVVDDMDMHITHIIRGEDHITSTPRQILLIQALGGSIPTYAHLPMIVGEDKKKLSKRHGAVTYQKFKELGYLPEAIINYLALLGWNAKDDKEYYTMPELIEAFTLENVTKAPAMFSYDKLDSINKHYISKLKEDELQEHIQSNITTEVATFLSSAQPGVVHKILHTIIKERINKWSDVPTVCNSDLNWLDVTQDLDTEKIVWKKSNKEDTTKHLNFILNKLEEIDQEDWTEELIKETIWSYAEDVGKGDVLWPMRYSLTGSERSPDPFTVAYILGQPETLKRLLAARDAL